MMRYKAKEKYKLSNGTIVPGVTTIVSTQLGWNKNTLIAWGNKVGLEGIEANKYRDDKADIGTLAHAFITDAIAGKKTSTDDFTKNQIDKAENSAISFYEWEKGKLLEPVFVEKPLVSEKLLYGGTPDIYCYLDKIPTLIDIKTGSGIYDEYCVQVSAYWNLIIENGYEAPQRIIILNIPRTEDEAFQERQVTKIDIWFEIFKNCLKNYYLKKQLEKEV